VRQRHILLIKYLVSCILYLVCMLQINTKMSEVNTKHKNNGSEIPDLRIHLKSQQRTILRRPESDHSCEFPIHYDYTE